MELRSKLPPLKTIATFAIIFLLFFAFFTKLTLKFYASFLFLFYFWTKRMWISVIILGIFQTLLMLPLRFVNLKQSSHIQEFKKELEKEGDKAQRFLVKKQVKQGDTRVLWYMINFFTQTISYLTIGRLFLTNFYTQPLDKNLLFDFVKYPSYPIKDIIFKIPYPAVTKTIDWGLSPLLIFWLAVLLIKVVYNIIKPSLGKIKQRLVPRPAKSNEKIISFSKQAVKFITGSSILLLILGWFVFRRFPVGWSINIFSGNISRPNPRFNLITAIATAITLIWLDMPRIRKKVEMATQQNIPKNIIIKIKKQLMLSSLRNAFFIGLGAFFITNQIPSAFELSIFTFELISLSSPLTFDRVILKLSGSI
jgi:hypothetical protein